MTQMTYFLRWMRKNNCVKGEIISSNFDYKLIKESIKRGYVKYNNHKDCYELTMKGINMVTMFDKH